MKKIIVFWGLLQLFALKAFCQVEGDVIDQQEKPVTNAIVIATDSLTNIKDTVKTDERGFYFFKKLNPGKYKIEAQAPGFLPTIHRFTIGISPEGANDTDDTYYAEIIDFILRRQKPVK
ncbi:MAG: carboxypeptidase-like regulatory domain-containing protein [Chitinophagaceae bacterium]